MQTAAGRRIKREIVGLFSPSRKPVASLESRQSDVPQFLGSMKFRDHSLPWARRITCSLLCLLLLFSMGSFALATPRLACCNGNYCPMQRHHNAASHQDESGGMDCHHDAGAMLSCSLSCCHVDTQHSLAPNAFDLPYFAFHSGPAPAESHFAASIPAALFRMDKPVTPPPRMAVL
jgi:hypothetical protein